MRRPVRILFLAALGVAAIAAAALWAVYHATQHVPEFYRETLAADPAAEKKASEHLLQQATSLQNHARREGTWHATFTADEINGWLAFELPHQQDALPSQLRDPRVQIRSDGIILACRAEWGGFSTVASLEIGVYVDSPGVVALRIRKARAGALPWPLKPVLDGLARAARHANLHVRWLQAGGDPVALVSLPPLRGEQGNVVRVDQVQLDEGAVHIAGTTERAK